MRARSMHYTREILQIWLIYLHNTRLELWRNFQKIR